jgi:hypothetical protein
VLFPCRANADSSLGRVNHICLTLLVTTPRVQQTRALTSTTEQVDRNRSSDYTPCNRTRVAGHCCLSKAAAGGVRDRVFTTRYRNVDSNKNPAPCLGLRRYGRGTRVSSCPFSRIPSALPLKGWQESPFCSISLPSSVHLPQSLIRHLFRW